MTDNLYVGGVDAAGVNQRLDFELSFATPWIDLTTVTTAPALWLIQPGGGLLALSAAISTGVPDAAFRPTPPAKAVNSLWLMHSWLPYELPVAGVYYVFTAALTTPPLPASSPVSFIVKQFPH